MTAKVPRRFRIIIHGESPARWRPDNAGKIGYLLERLCSGKPVDLGGLAHYGLKVEIEEDTDQGDD